MPNPHPKPPRVVNLRSLARTYTEESIRTLGRYASGKDDVPPAVRVAAIAILLDRGWGRVSQAHPVDGEGDIRITIRHIIDGSDGQLIDGPALVIEHQGANGVERDG